ncbi:von Willebrand factor type A, partial [Aphelenchoides avenae]
KVKATKPAKKAAPKATKSPASKAKKAPVAKAKKASAPKASPSKRSASKAAASSGARAKKQATPAVSQVTHAPPAALPQHPAAAAKAPTQPLKAEVVFSFDTTGSMYPCLTQVRRKVKECAERLFEEIGADNLRIGITAHGDYCDKATYVTKHLPLTTNVNAIADFVENVQATFGGDAPEAYELVLHEAQNFAWMNGWVHVLVLIGDDQPHGKNDPQNEKHLDWKEELDKLKAKNIVVHGVQALNRQYASSFYAECAKRT